MGRGRKTEIKGRTAASLTRFLHVALEAPGPEAGTASPRCARHGGKPRVVVVRKAYLGDSGRRSGDCGRSLSAQKVRT